MKQVVNKQIEKRLPLKQGNRTGYPKAASIN